MLKLIAVTICGVLGVVIDSNGLYGVLAFTAPLTCRRKPIGSLLFAMGGAEPQHAATEADIFDAHFKKFVSEDDVSSLLSVCYDVQNSQDFLQAEWVDSCKVVDGQQTRAMSTVIATKNIKRGDVLTLYPIHALGLRNVCDSIEGIDYIAYGSVKDQELFKDKIEDTMKLDIPVSRKMTSKGYLKGIPCIPQDIACIATGKKPFIRMFTVSLPDKKVVPGWLGGVINTTPDTKKSNCIMVPLPHVAPFSAVVATNDIEVGEEIIRGLTPDWDLEDKLKEIVANDQKRYISLLRRRLMEALFVGPFHQINLDFPGVKKIHSDPDIYEIDDFLSDDECERLIIKATPYTEVGKNMKADGTWIESEKKTHLITNIPKNEMPSIMNRVQRLMCCKEEEIGQAHFIHYEKGKMQKIEPHVDEKSLPEFQLFQGSPRNSDTKTYHRWGILFCYLNDVNEGAGETHFPEIDLTVKPKKGSALLHFPMDIKGRTDP